MVTHFWNLLLLVGFWLKNLKRGIRWPFPTGLNLTLCLQPRFGFRCGACILLICSDGTNSWFSTGEHTSPLSEFLPACLCRLLLLNCLWPLAQPDFSTDLWTDSGPRILPCSLVHLCVASSFSLTTNLLLSLDLSQCPNLCFRRSVGCGLWGEGLNHSAHCRDSATSLGELVSDQERRLSSNWWYLQFSLRCLWKRSRGGEPLGPFFLLMLVTQLVTLNILQSKQNLTIFRVSDPAVLPICLEWVRQGLSPGGISRPQTKTPEWVPTLSPWWSWYSVASLFGTERGHGGVVVTHSPVEVGGSNPGPYVGKLAVAYALFTLKAVCPLVRSFSWRRNCLQVALFCPSFSHYRWRATYWTRFFNGQ